MSVSNLRKGIWLFTQAEQLAQGPGAIRTMCERLAMGEFELINVCVKVKDGFLSYATKVGIVNPTFADWDPLEVFCEEAGKHGIKVYPCFCVFHEGDEGSKLLQQHGELRKILNGRPDGSAACAMRDEVQDYEFSLYREVMEQYDIAGVHLDYIRTGAGMCECNYCKDWVKKATGRDSADIAINHADEGFLKWCEWRTQNIAKFVERVHREAEARGLEVSAACIRGYPESIIDNGQDWVDWAEKGIIDYVFPMNYSVSTAFMLKRARIHMSMISDLCELWEGLGTWHTIEQAKAVKELGVKGVVFFQSKNKPLTDSDLKKLASL